MRGCCGASRKGAGGLLSEDGAYVGPSEGLPAGGAFLEAFDSPAEALDGLCIEGVQCTAHEALRVRLDDQCEQAAGPPHDLRAARTVGVRGEHGRLRRDDGPFAEGRITCAAARPRAFQVVACALRLPADWAVVRAGAPVVVVVLG